MDKVDGGIGKGEDVTRKGRGCLEGEWKEGGMMEGEDGLRETRGWRMEGERDDEGTWKGWGRE